MSPFERRLASRVAAIWLAIGVLIDLLFVITTLAAHRDVSPVQLTLDQWNWSFEALTGGWLAVYTWRSYERFRLPRYLFVLLLAFGAIDVARQGSFLAWRDYLPPTMPPSLQSVLFVSAIRLTHFFILVLGVAAATLAIRWHERGLAMERAAAAMEAALAEARIRSLRSQIQPGLVRESLLRIETLLEDAPPAAESRLLDLSDFLRLALLRATGKAKWSPDLEGEYLRLQSEMTEAGVQG